MKKFTNFIKISLIATIFYFLFLSFRQNFDKLLEFNFTLDPFYSLLSFLWMLLALIFPVFCWIFLLKILNQNIKVKNALKIWFAANLGRYLPGKIWQITGLIYLGTKEKLEKKALTQSVIYAQIISLLSGSSLAVFIFSDTLEEIVNFNLITLKITIITINFILFIKPDILIHLGNYFLTKINKDTLSLKINCKDFFIYYSLQIINWLGLGFSLYLLAKAVGVDPKLNFQILLSLPLSWIIGLLAIFSPGGIGVREGMLSLLLTNFMPQEVALTLPWLHRATISLAELTLTLIFSHSYIKKIKSKRILTNKK